MPDNNFSPPSSQPNRADNDLNQLTAGNLGQNNSMYRPNPKLENAAQQAAPTYMHPMIQAILQRFALLNLIRNRRNMGQVDPTSGQDI